MTAGKPDAKGMVAGKVALVTGAARGIGRASAELLAAEGAALMLADRDGGLLEEVCGPLRAQGASVESFAADVSAEDQVQALLAGCVERFGRLDCAVNNAGITGAAAPLSSSELANWSRVLAVNLTGVFLCVKHELARMQEQGCGAIVNVASGSGVVATPGLAAYCASKHGVLGLTKTAAAENAGSGIRINAVCPGTTDTPMLRSAIEKNPQLEPMILASQPGGRLARPGEIAEAIVWLCSDRASFVSGATLLVDAGAVSR